MSEATEVEVIIIVNIMMEAHGRCISCAHYLLDLFLQQFPEHKALVKQRYKERFKQTYKWEFPVTTSRTVLPTKGHAEGNDLLTEDSDANTR